MIPLRDMIPTRTRPVVTEALIMLNVGVYLVQLLLGSDDAERLTLRFGLVPAVLTGGSLFVPNSLGGAAGALVTPLTSMFLHGGLMHLVGNMWFLWIFGDNVEESLGRLRYLAYYLLTGLCAAGLQVASAPTSVMPMVGASGAISGILAGYVLLHPRARIVTLVPLVIFFTTFEIPAFWFIFIWFGLQLLNGLVSLQSLSQDGGVAWWAHVGGFIGGFAFLKAFLPDVADRWERMPPRGRSEPPPRSREDDWGR